MYFYLSPYQFGNQVKRLRDPAIGPRLVDVIANALDFSHDVTIGVAVLWI